MKHLLISAFLAALVIGANVSLANANTQQVSKTAAAEASTKLKLNQASAEQLAAAWHTSGLAGTRTIPVASHASPQYLEQMASFIACSWNSGTPSVLPSTASSSALG